MVMIRVLNYTTCSNLLILNPQSTDDRFLLKRHQEEYKAIAIFCFPDLARFRTTSGERVKSVPEF
jgi:hypothetical protein